MEINEIRKKIKKELNKERYEHTKGVMYTAGCMAMAYGYPFEKAMLAGLLHDCAKCVPKEQAFRLCEENDILLTQAECESPYLIHAKLGAYLAETLYDVTDAEILHAIRVHTTGEPDMNTLDKIIYIADYIEPGRDVAPNLEDIRKLAFHDLDACMAKILSDTLTYLTESGRSIDDTTKIAYEYYRPYLKEQV